MSKIRVVLDTNCLISALVFSKGRLAQLRQHWQAGSFIPLVCKESIHELIRVLAYPKFKSAEEEIHILLEEILPYAEVITLQHLDKIENLRDTTDEIFIHLAIQEQASALVSGDKHILELVDQVHIPIMTVIEFLTWLDKKI